MRTSQILTTSTAIRKSIQAVLRSSKTACIAVPFWGGNPLDFLGLDPADTKKLKVICNLPSGACDPNAIKDLLGHGAQVRSNSTLHAKVYLGEEIAIVGSANVSFRALGQGKEADAHTGSDEICAELKDSEDIKVLSTWFHAQWGKSADLNDPRIGELLLDLAAKMRRAEETQERSLVDDLIENPKKFQDEKIFITLDWTRYSKKVKRLVEEANSAIGQDSIDAWEGWPEMPASAEILSFYYDKNWRTPIAYEGSYLTPNDPSKAMDKKTDGILVAKTGKILGVYTMSGKDRRAFNAGVKKMNMDRLKRKLKKEGQCMHISEFAKRYMT